MSLTIFGMCHIKCLNLLDGLRNYSINHGGKNGERSYAKFMRKNQWLYQDSVSALQSSFYMVAKINDNADVCIQIKTVPENRKLKTSFENQFALKTTKQIPIWFMLQHGINQ